MLYDNSRYLFFCVIVLMVSGYTTLLLRIYTRVTRKTWGWDDSIATVAAIPFAWLCRQTIVAANNGLGAHSWHITPEMSQQAYKAFVFFQVSYCCSIILIKASIAMMLTRIICGQYMILWTLRITVALFSSITLSVAIYCLLQCRPLAKTWNPAIEGYCHPSNVLASLSMTVTVSSIISDVIICLSPIPLLWNIQMNRNLKIVSGFLLSLGFFASICAIIRLAYTLALNSTEDYLFHVYGVTVWCFAEVGVALTVGCSSTLRPMFRACLGGTGESKKESNDTSRGTYELRTGANDGVIRSQNDDGQITRVATEPSVGDDESARKMLGPSEIRVTHRFDVREEV